MQSISQGNFSWQVDVHGLGRNGGLFLRLCRHSIWSKVTVLIHSNYYKLLYMFIVAYLLVQGLLLVSLQDENIHGI